jgi:zinc protease
VSAIAESGLQPVGDLEILARRPGPGTPRPYHFPPFERHVLDNGLTVITADLPGRPLITAQLLLEGGAADEPAQQAGVTALAARALTEGTAGRSAIELIEAAERLGAELHAEAGWEIVAALLDVPRRHLEPALGLLAEIALQPSFPVEEVTRLRDERLNDLLQARAEPRRRVEWAFTETIYASDSPYARPQGGIEETVGPLDGDLVAERHRALLDPAAATLVVAGDLRDVPWLSFVSEGFGAWRGEGEPRSPFVPEASASPDGTRVVLIDRPGSAQTEVRVGHVGLPRRIPDYHPVAVMSAILGGLFDSRLQRLLREERGYTYGVGAGFDLRRGAGPFSVRTAVQTEVTVPALRDILDQVRGMVDQPVSDKELTEARDYLVGVFPLRFETAGQVAGAISGLVIHGLPDDELDRYRPAVSAVTGDEVAAAARDHLRPDELSVVLVGDAARIGSEIEAASFGPLTIVSEPLPTTPPA